MFYNARLEISKYGLKYSQTRSYYRFDLNILKIVYESKNHEIGASEIAQS